MKFKKLITLNWGVVQDGEYPLGDLTAITGETGVGKSSFGDAIQTVMGAALKNILVYNAGQDEAQNKKRNKEYRTLEGYISGEDQFRFARPEGCTGIVALVFQSSGKEPAHRFSAILNTTVSFEIYKGNKVPKIDNLKFFIVKAHEVSQEDFVGEGGKLYSYAKLRGRLTARYGKNSVVAYRGKEDFLCGLWGHLWGKETTSPIYAKRAAKAFCNFINAKPVDDINAFVRNEFLEPKNMKEQVVSLSEALRSLDRAKKEAHDIEAGITLVTEVVDKSDTLLSQWYENKAAHCSYALYRVKSQQQKMKAYHKKFTKAETDLKAYEKELERLRQEMERSEESIVLLQSKMGESEAYRDYRSLEAAMQENKKVFEKLKRQFLLERIDAFDSFRNHLKNLEESTLPIVGRYEMFEALGTTLETCSDLSLRHYFSQAAIDEEAMPLRLKALETMLIAYDHHIEALQEDEAVAEVRRQLEIEMEENVTLRQHLEGQRRAVEEELADLERNVVHLPRTIKADFDTLKAHLPEVDFKMLYEHVDLKPEYGEWREAIEGFLGDNRYAIMVDLEHEVAALTIVQKERLGLKIIQGKKVTQEIAKMGKSVNENAIAFFLNATHPVAEAYILSSLRNVMAIEALEQLKKAGRGIMKNALAVNANTMFSCRLKEPRYLFGAEGREKTRRGLEKEAVDIRTAFDRAETQRALLKKVTHVFLTLEDAYKNRDTHQALFENLFASFREYRKVKEALSLMDINDLVTLQNDIEKYRKEKERLLSRRDMILKSSGEQEALMREREGIENELKKEWEKREKIAKTIKEEYREICRLYAPKEFESHIEALEASIDVEKREMPKPKPLEAVVINAWSTFMQHYGSTALLDAPKVQVPLDFPYDTLLDRLEVFRALVSLKQKFREEKNALEQAQAFVYRQKIEEANEKFERTFMNDFCNTIHIHIREGRESIGHLNSALEKHRFGSDKFAVSALDPDPELKEYKAYFQSIYELKDAASETSLLSTIYDDAYRTTTQKLTELIKEGDKRGAELERLSDYRNYYNYDIVQTNGEKEISLSRNGKMSGGQGETSYYVIRSINLHAALKAKDMSGHALEAVFMDESFSKTNEKRAKEIIDYLNTTMGFQIVFAMPTKHIGSFLNLDLTGYHFTKMPLNGSKNGELDYKIWVQHRKLHGEEIKRLYEKEDLKIREEIEREATELFGVGNLSPA